MNQTENPLPKTPDSSKSLVKLFVLVVFTIFLGVILVLRIYKVPRIYDYIDINNINLNSNTSCDEQDTLKNAKACTFLIGDKKSGHGTGFVINEEGYAVTNLHVINGYTNGKVPITIDGVEQLTRVVGYSTNDDLAVIKIDMPIASCDWVDSDLVDLAENVYAIGWPNDSQGESTITKGIISRKVKNSNTGVEMIQTDTPINPGNSGGPLINKCGVIGINSSKNLWVQEAPSEGIGFAITSNYAKGIVDFLISNDDGSEVVIPVQTSIPDLYKQESSVNSKDFDYYSNQKVDYDYEKVRYWEERRNKDKQVKSSWQDLLGSKYADQSDVSSLLKKLDKQVILADFLWDGYTNSKITYREASDAESQYSQINSESVALSLKLTKDIKQNAYEDCVSQWEKIEDETGDSYSDSKKDCKDLLN